MRKTNKSLVLSGIVLIILVASVVSMLIYHEHSRYRKNMQLLCDIVADEADDETAVHTVSSLMKNRLDADSKKGAKILKSYGYDMEENNVFYNEYRKQCYMYITIGAVFYLLSMGLIHIVIKMNKSMLEYRLGELKDMLSEFRNGNYEVKAEYEYSDKEDIITRIYADIGLLGDYLKLLNERITIEKEETKSLVSDISHQLKTPVAALKTSFEILMQDNLSDEERQEFSMRCSYQLEAVENLLKALINISRMETGMIDIKKSDSSIFDTITEAVNRVYVAADAKNIEIELDAEDSISQLIVSHDKKWMCEAFLNILENAVKYSSENTKIVIRMFKRTSVVRIEISDMGLGIDSDEFNKIFKRFYRSNDEKVRKQNGSGIGLYLTREIITRHSGSITVASKGVNKGSTFIIRLPYNEF